MTLVPAIVIVTYNRPASLQRLLGSIEKADYAGFSDIPLLISIDGDGDPGVLEIASRFEWKHGSKDIIQHSQNLGLRDHILSCGDLSEQYDNVIILEDDILVSKNYYQYSSKALKYYKADKRITCIGLYAYQYNENAFLPFSPLIDGHDAYFLQHPCSWGQAWSKEQWRGFKEYYENKATIFSETPMPESVKNWPDSSWKKYYAQYMADRNKYVVYPQVSYTTNFADPGENWHSDLPFFQVALEQQERPKFSFVSFDHSHNKYDAYFEMLPENLVHHGACIDPDTCIDLYGSKQKEPITGKYLLSSKACREALISFGGELKPLLQNILQHNPGEFFSYGLCENFSKEVPGSTRNQIWEKQHAQGFYFASKTRYYKLGYYFFHPMKFVRKRFLK